MAKGAHKMRLDNVSLRGEEGGLGDFSKLEEGNAVLHICCLPSADLSVLFCSLALCPPSFGLLVCRGLRGPFFLRSALSAHKMRLEDVSLRGEEGAGGGGGVGVFQNWNPPAAWFSLGFPLKPAKKGCPISINSPEP